MKVYIKIETPTSTHYLDAIELIESIDYFTFRRNTLVEMYSMGYYIGIADGNDVVFPAEVMKQSVITFNVDNEDE